MELWGVGGRHFNRVFNSMNASGEDREYMERNISPGFS